MLYWVGVAVIHIMTSESAVEQVCLGFLGRRRATKKTLCRVVLCPDYLIEVVDPLVHQAQLWTDELGVGASRRLATLRAQLWSELWNAGDNCLKHPDYSLNLVGEPLEGLRGASTVLGYAKAVPISEQRERGLRGFSQGRLCHRRDIFFEVAKR
ncbi:hypothetical protein BHE74_00007116 [Ensete ventricosum]|nr:hypothetical protein BHE74_00007116 [Ensete ventricosum]